MQPKHPEIYLPLVGEDGNAFFILARAQKVMRKAGLSREEIDEFMTEARSGDYDTLLSTCHAWFDVWGEED